ncbi:MAG: glycoside hydrolase family 16 protein [Rikenellaceae bacterium]
MKNFILIFAFATLITIGCKPTNDASTSDWELVWSDEFNSNQLDTSVWTRIGRGRSDWDRHMSLYEPLLEVKDGTVILKAIENTVDESDRAEYITAGIYTKDKKTFGYGRVEIKAKYGSAQGYWPALWLLPSERQRWPQGGEIDIMEHLNFDTIAYQTIHTPYTLSNGYIDNPPKGAVASVDKDDYNIYAVERYRDSICFFINGKKTNTYPRIDSLENRQQFPFNQSDFYLLMDSQLGGSWVGNVNIEQLPVEMTIDWVRYYEPKQK